MEKLAYMVMGVGCFWALVAGILVHRWYVSGQEELEAVRFDERCQQTCVMRGQLRVETVTEKPGCYCADYAAVHRMFTDAGM